MHDRAKVVWSDVVTVRDVLVEVVLHARDDAGKVDADKQVAVFAALFVPQADNVADLMNHSASVTSRREIDELLVATPADLRRTAAAGLNVMKSVSVVRAGNRNPVFASQCAIASVTRA